jgi:O-antigen/teichoic acid export membrane protein
MKWVLLGNIFSSLTSFVIIVVLTQFGEAEDVGLFSYIQGIVLPIHMFFTFKLRTIQSVDYENTITASYYHYARFIGGILFLVTCVLVSSIFLSDFELVAALIFALGYFPMSLRESFLTLGIKHKLWFLFFKSNLTYFIVSVALFSSSYFFTRNLLTALFFIVLARALSYIYERSKYYAILGNDIFEVHDNLRSRFYGVVQLVRKGAPLAVTALLGALFMTVPKLVLEARIGLEAVGVFTVLTLVLFAFNLLVNSFIQARTPEFAELYITNQSQFVSKLIQLIINVTILTFASFILLSIFGEKILSLGFGKEYAPYSSEFSLVAISGGSLALFSVGNMLLSCQRNFRVQPAVYAVILFVLTILCFMLLPRLQISGVIVSQFLSYILGFLLCLFIFLRNRSNNASIN